jgi:hypothetical protein
MIVTRQIWGGQAIGRSPNGLHCQKIEIRTFPSFHFGSSEAVPIGSARFNRGKIGCVGRGEEDAVRARNRRTDQGRPKNPRPCCAKAGDPIDRGAGDALRRTAGRKRAGNPAALRLFAMFGKNGASRIGLDGDSRQNRVSTRLTHRLLTGSRGGHPLSLYGPSFVVVWAILSRCMGRRPRIIYCNTICFPPGLIRTLLIR